MKAINFNSRKIVLITQIGSRRNLQRIEGFAINRLIIRQNVLAIFIFMSIGLEITVIKNKMRIAS